MDLLRARHFRTGEWVKIGLDDRTIASVEPDERPEHPGDDWVGPAFWDIQTNGRWGVSFSDPTLTSEQVGRIVSEQPALGSARICPTLITAPLDAMEHGVRVIAAACDADRDVAARIVGLHLEGPYISSLDGYRGAHPLDAVRDPDWDDFQRLQDASGGRVVLMTLAPERPGALTFIRRAVDSGVAIAIGHTAAEPTLIRAAVDSGASLSTHLGNGIISNLPRHPNPIWEQAASDDLFASFIADGHHLDASTLKVLARAKTPDRTILVSDASPLAGLPPGTHGPWAVDPSGKIVVAGTPYLAGSNQGLEVGLNTLIRASGWSLAQAFATVTTQPARLLGKPEPEVRPGAPANLVVFRRGEAEPNPITLLRTCVDGQWINACDNNPSPF